MGKFSPPLAQLAEQEALNFEVLGSSPRGRTIMITLEIELSRIRGLSPNFITKLTRLKITVKDLLWHFPYRYDDFSITVNIADLNVGQSATVSGIIKKVEMRRTWRRRMILVEAIVADHTGGIKAVWFNQPYIGKILRPGLRANLAGKVALQNGEIYLSNPAYEPLRLASETKHTAGLIPVYPESRGLTSRGFRYLIKPLLRVLPPFHDFIPAQILSPYELPELNVAIHNIHFPKNLTLAERARKRFAFEDLFLLQINNLKLRSKLAKEKAPVINADLRDLEELFKALPFKLTSSQCRSLDEFLKDLGSERPMNRLLQGDVGSGKTVIATIAAIISAKNQRQTAFMTPTEILAHQHFETLNKFFGELAKNWALKSACY